MPDRGWANFRDDLPGTPPFQQLPLNGLKRTRSFYEFTIIYIPLLQQLNGRPSCGNSTVGGDLGPRTSNPAKGELVHAGIIGAVHEIVCIRYQTIYRGRVHGKNIHE